MSTATVLGFNKSSTAAGSSLLGIVAAELNRIFRKPVKASTTVREQAEALRRYADDFAGDDPRFADDLYAAASRHEGLV
jgi:hypothetical protein